MRCPSDPHPHSPAPHFAVGALAPRAVSSPSRLAGALSPCATCSIGPACPFFGPASPAAH